MVFQSTFTVVLCTPKGNKVAGICELDLANYANPENQGTQIRPKMFEKLD